MKAFSLVWLGQSVSTFGSALSSFALGVWVYETTGSATQFALIAFCFRVPPVLFGAYAGALVDRWDRRRTMVAADCGAGLATLALAALLWGGDLAVWHVYLVVALSRTCDIFQVLAFSASRVLLVPRRHLARTNGMALVGPAAAQIGAPMAAGALLAGIGLRGIVLVDLATFLFATLTLLLVRIPRPAPSAAGEAGSGSLTREAIYGWTYIRRRPGLLALLLFLAVSNFSLGVLHVLLTPLVLAFAPAPVLGVVLGVAAAGAVAGGLAVSLWGGPRRHLAGVLGFTVLQGAILLLGGVRPNVWLVSAAAFLVLFCSPVIRASSEAIWQVKVPADLQGRVLAVRRMIAGSTFPLSALAAGPLADRVFTPLLLPGGALAGTLGKVVGVGPGRGIGLFISALGVLTLAAVAVAGSYPRLRRVEEELPDALAADPPGVGSAARTAAAASPL